MLWWMGPPFPSLGAEAKGEAKAEWAGQGFQQSIPKGTAGGIAAPAIRK